MKKSPAPDQSTPSGMAASTVSRPAIPLSRATSSQSRGRLFGGNVTHEVTVVAVVGIRFGRDLSSIAAAYARMYDKPLLATITERTSSDFQRLLVAVVQGAIDLAPGAAGSSTSF